MDLLPWDGADEHGYFGTYREDCEAMIEEGFLDRKTLERAVVQAHSWLGDPRAFHFHLTVFVAGQV